MGAGGTGRGVGGRFCEGVRLWNGERRGNGAWRGEGGRGSGGRVAGLYGAGRAWHAGAFPALEDEMCGLLAGGGNEGPGRSPDRADAMVWAMSALMLGPGGRPTIRTV